jgi:hypothetical protein
MEFFFYMKYCGEHLKDGEVGDACGIHEKCIQNFSQTRSRRKW